LVFIVIHDTTSLLSRNPQKGDCTAVRGPNGRFCLPPQMFSVIPRKFLPGVKNPCWHEEYTGNITSDPYERNQYERYSKRFRTPFEFLRNSFREHLFLRDGRLYRTRCLPYFYIIGQPKCGTTDLYDRLRLHPDVRFSISKEPHWWTRKRFGKFWETLYTILRAGHDPRPGNGAGLRIGRVLASVRGQKICEEATQMYTENSQS